MSMPRALLTETERERIRDGADVDRQRRYEAVSRVRRRIQEEMRTDVDVLKENHPQLYEELRAAVCDSE